MHGSVADIYRDEKYEAMLNEQLRKAVQYISLQSLTIRILCAREWEERCMYCEDVFFRWDQYVGPIECEDGEFRSWDEVASAEEKARRDAMYCALSAESWKAKYAVRDLETNRAELWKDMQQ